MVKQFQKMLQDTVAIHPCWLCLFREHSSFMDKKLAGLIAPQVCRFNDL
jgi:hypothetical protein